MDKSTEGEAVIRPVNGEKLSRWWIVLHLWGGICLKMYLDVSGLSKLILGAPSGSDPASASSYAGAATLVAVGAVAIGYILSRSLVIAIDGSLITKRKSLFSKQHCPLPTSLL